MSELISNPQSEPGLEAARAGSDAGPDRLQQPTIVVRYDAAFDPSDRSGEVDGDGHGAVRRPRRGRAAHPGIPRCPGTRPPRDDVGPHAGGLSLSAMGRGDRVLDPDPGCHRPHAAGQADAQGGHLPAEMRRPPRPARTARKTPRRMARVPSRIGPSSRRRNRPHRPSRRETRRAIEAQRRPAPAPPLDAAPAPSSPIAVAGPTNSTVAEGTLPPPDSTTTNKESVPAPPPLTAQTGASAPRRCDGRPDPGARTADTPPDGIPGNADGPGRVGAASESGTSAPPGPRGRLATDSCADRVGPAGERDPRTTGGIGPPGDRRGSEADRRGRCRECALLGSTGSGQQPAAPPDAGPADSAIPAHARINRPGLVARTRSCELPSHPVLRRRQPYHRSPSRPIQQHRGSRQAKLEPTKPEPPEIEPTMRIPSRRTHRANPDRERRPRPGLRGSRTAWRSRRPSRVNKAHLNRPARPTESGARTRHPGIRAGGSGREHEARTGGFSSRGGEGPKSHPEPRLPGPMSSREIWNPNRAGAPAGVPATVEPSGHDGTAGDTRSEGRESSTVREVVPAAPTLGRTARGEAAIRARCAGTPEKPARDEATSPGPGDIGGRAIRLLNADGPGTLGDWLGPNPE